MGILFWKFPRKHIACKIFFVKWIAETIKVKLKYKMQNEITQCSAAYIIDFQQVNAGFQEVIRKAIFVATKLLFVQIFSLLVTKDTLGIVKIYKTDIKSRKCKQTLRCFFFCPQHFLSRIHICIFFYVKPCVEPNVHSFSYVCVTFTQMWPLACVFCETLRCS